MLEDSINYATRGDHSGEVMVIGCGISAIVGLLLTFVTIFGMVTLGLGLIFYPVALIPAVFLLGYYVRVLGTTASGGEELPAFDRFGTLAKDGVVASVVLTVYYAIPLVVLVVFSGVGAGIDADLGAAAGTLGLLVAGLLGLCFTYVFPAALTNYGKTGDIASAFALGDVANVVLTVDYVGSWLFGMVLAFVGSIVAVIVGMVPFIGWILAPSVGFVSMIPTYRAFGLAFRRASDEADVATADRAPA